MSNMAYTLDRRVDGAFDDIIARAGEALTDEGFGVLCDIDIQHAFAEKLDAEFRKHRILGARNPPLAKQAIEEELQLGALLPCNVVVYETDDGGVGVSAVDPNELLWWSTIRRLTGLPTTCASASTACSRSSPRTDDHVGVGR